MNWEFSHNATISDDGTTGNNGTTGNGNNKNGAKSYNGGNIKANYAKNAKYNNGKDEGDDDQDDNDDEDNEVPSSTQPSVSGQVYVTKATAIGAEASQPQSGCPVCSLCQSLSGGFF